MEPLQEDKAGYASADQREVLLGLVEHPTIRDVFFLTGGTALSVFYLSHRVSDDIDLFSFEPTELAELDFWIKIHWGSRCSQLRKSPQFLSMLIDGVKVDLVIDPLSFRGPRQRFPFDKQRDLQVDTLYNIASNKFTAVVSRTEPKDFVDLYLILQIFPEYDLEDLYQKSRLKDAIFDDPPTAAFQLETGIAFLRENPSLWPRMIRKLNWEDLFDYYKKVTRWIYDLGKK
jgi:predicted nucleotidyltransferase component of viral defense system